jgi:hypothetical protein
MARTANDLIRDDVVQRKILVLRYGRSLGEQVVAILDETEGRIKALVETNTPNLQARVRKVRSLAWDRVEELLVRDLDELAEIELEHFDEMVQGVSPVLLATTLPVLSNISGTTQLQGRRMREWLADIRRADLARIAAAINIARAQGQTVRQATRAILGTSDVDGANGVTQVARRHSAALALMGAIAVVAAARALWVLLNKEYLGDEIYVAVLDSHTTVMCANLDGKIFAIGKGPYPPIHWGCRSDRVAVLDWRKIATRPARGYAEKELRGLSPEARRKRVAELIGEVPSRVTYEQWLADQSETFQNEMLGINRARLLRSGGLKLKDFVDRQNQKLTLGQLRARHTDVFDRLGI